MGYAIIFNILELISNVALLLFASVSTLFAIILLIAERSFANWRAP